MTDIELQALVALMNSDICRMHADNAAQAAEGFPIAYRDGNWPVTGLVEVELELQRRGLLS